jgi:hypothetical protein
MKAIVTSQTAYQSPLVELQQQPQESPAISPCVNLKAWCNQRVLAKRKDFYVPGVTRASTNLPNCVLVALDFPEGQQQLYQDIFASGKYDVISDAAPPPNEVNFASLNFPLISQQASFCHFRFMSVDVFVYTQ